MSEHRGAASIHKKSVAVAMSGGVDSSVTAALLKKQGYAVRGFFMELAQPDLAAQVERVRRVAAVLEVPLEVVDMRGAFRRQVLDYFAAGYGAGITPNPCMVCNRAIKAGRLLEVVRERGIDRLATGHYARIEAGSDGRYRLLRGLDPAKDQSYFLGRLSQEQLAGLLMPLGGMVKSEVRRLAVELGLAGVHGSESQDVCFLAGRSVADFLGGEGVGTGGSGDIVTADGRRLGRHQGIHTFTIGQRRGLGIPDATPYYVIALDPGRNRVVVGKEEELWQRRLIVGRVNWLAGRPPRLPAVFSACIRYRHSGAVAEVSAAAADCLPVAFDEPQRAVAPGQFAVFYDGDEVIGSGEILGNHQAGAAARQGETETG